MNEELYAEYNAAIGAVMLAQKQYTDACDDQGMESWAAERAREYLDREIEHRDRVREVYDAAARRRAPGMRDG